MRAVKTPVLGAVYLPSSPGTAVGWFDFLVDPETGAKVEIGTPVAADTTEGVVVGVIVDMHTIGTGRDPIAADLGGSYDRAHVASIPEVVLAGVQVFHSDAMRPVRAGLVRAASAEEMLEATGYPRMDWPIPAGVVPLADGSWGRVCWDGVALLGPESAHLTVGGLSGQAAKTSYMGVALKAAIDAGSPDEHSVAALLFNVKGTDLLYLDQPPTEGYELTDDDHAMYEALSIPAEPFDNVAVWAPSLPGGNETRSDRDDALTLRWDLVRLWRYLRYFFPNLYEDDKMQNFTAQFEDLCLRSPSAHNRIDTFDKLQMFFDDQIAQADQAGSSECWNGRVHIATMRRMRRQLMGLVARCGGLLARGSTGDTQDIPDKGWSHSQVVVVDLAGLSTEVQAFVIARTCERLLESAENGELGVDHLVVMADELNAFAPAVGGEMAQVRKILQRISTQGRYAGISLWGAAQKLSKVDELVRDNAASRAAGILAEAEISSGVYGRLPGGLAERIATLPKGHMALWHYSFRSALVVRFPRPAWQTGKARRRRRPTTTSVLRASGRELSARSTERLLEGIPDEVAEQIIASADDGVTAVRELERRRVPDMSKIILHEPSRADPNDPYGIDS